MGLVDLAEVLPALACPRCGAPVAEAPEALHCTAAGCELREAGSFPRVGRWPALVDFADSILALEELRAAAAPAPRGWSIERVPRPLRAWWKPPNRVAARNVAELLRRLEGPAPLVLVVGGGTAGNGVEALYGEGGPRVVAFDIYGSPLVQFVADAHRIPLADGSVDAVVVQAVLEHVLDPDRVVSEIHRVLRRDGLVYAETPFLQPVHAGPYDFTRFTASGHRWLFRGFEELDAGVVAGPGAALLAGVDHVVRGALRSQLAGRLARAAFAWLRQLDRLVPARFAMDDASAYYFLGRRAETELTPRAIVHYYRGAQGGAHPSSPAGD